MMKKFSLILLIIFGLFVGCQNPLGGNNDENINNTPSTESPNSENPANPPSNPPTAPPENPPVEEPADPAISPAMQKVLRIEKEVRDLIFYDLTNDGIPDFNNDIGTIGGVCTDYSMEFAYRYSGEVYVVFMRSSSNNIWWLKVDEWLPSDYYNYRTSQGFGINIKEYWSIERSEYYYGYDGILRDANTSKISSELWTEETHKNSTNHAWNVIVIEGVWYLLDITNRDQNEAKYPIVEIPTPNWAQQ